MSTPEPGADLRELDCRGRLCPLPVIRTQDRIRGLAPDTELEVLATDPGTRQDIPAWCRVHGHELISEEEAEEEAQEETGAADARGGRIYRFRIRVSPYG